MKVKLLKENARNMIAMAIDDTKPKTVIYLHGVSKKTGEEQWYESKGVFTKSTALNYFYAGEFTCVFAQGMTKSSVKNWL